jgi:transcriptional regulator with XRE-family HTH domain
MIADESNAGLDLHDGEAIADAVRRTLLVRGLTLYGVAALSWTRFPHEPAYHIRRNFYFQLRSGLTPTLQQVLALAEVTQSRLWDWFGIFGFSLGDIPRLQATLNRPSTTLIDADLVDPEALLPFLRYRRPEASFQTTAPLSQLLDRSGFYKARDLIAPAHNDFVYAKIGTEDAFAFPDLLPGSIVRADRRLVPTSLPREPGQHSHHLFLVEHPRGLNCGRLRATAPHRIAFVADTAPVPNLQFRLGTEARILGVVDFELRFPTADENRRDAVAQVSNIAKPWNPARITPLLGRRPGGFLRNARLRAGLSFRSASKLSRWIAKRLGDDRYFTSPGTLSDYEAAGTLPRHIHKLFALAIPYGIGFRDLLRAFDILLGDLDAIAHGEKTKVEDSGGFFETLKSRFGDVPLFLADALPGLSGLAHVSLRDVFWLAGQPNSLHPALRGAVLVLVNRRNKKPKRLPKIPAGEQPLYLLEHRDGSYVAGSCGLEKGRLVLYADPQRLPGGRTRRFIDADVVGQIAGIARWLISPP